MSAMARKFFLTCALLCVVPFLLVFTKSFQSTAKFSEIIFKQPTREDRSSTATATSRSPPKPTANVTSCSNELKEEDMLDPKTVLFWNVPFGNDKLCAVEFIIDDFEMKPGQTFSLASPTCGRCDFTFDRSLLDKADSVVFHSSHNRGFPYPDHRKSSQKFVYWNEESTNNYRDVMKAHYYNLTMTVRRSSGVYAPYDTLPRILKKLKRRGGVNDPMLLLAKLRAVAVTSGAMLKSAIASLPQPPPEAKRHTDFVHEFSDNQDLVRAKDRMAIWIVSNCRNKLPRNKLAESLRGAGLRLDQFGACTRPFPITSRWDPGFSKVVAKYKFYLAFENSFHCQDYMTEKIWHNALLSGTVPVVFGPTLDDVKAVLPEKSFIHVESFNSSKELVGYLEYLDKNASAYAEYLEWRTWTKYLDKAERWNIPAGSENAEFLRKLACGPPAGFCGLCRKLHERQVSHQVVADFGQWWLKEENKECLEPQFAKSFVDAFGK